MAKNDLKKAVIRVPFPKENENNFKEITTVAKKHGLSLASFGRISMIHYMEGIKNKTIIL